MVSQADVHAPYDHGPLRTQKRTFDHPLPNFATIFSGKLGVSATCRKINIQIFDDNRDDGGSTDLIASVSVPTNNHFFGGSKKLLRAQSNSPLKNPPCRKKIPE
jgi:hypothetical protein